MTLVGKVIVGAGRGDDRGGLWWEVVMGCSGGVVLGVWLWSDNRLVVGGKLVIVVMTVVRW